MAYLAEHKCQRSQQLCCSRRPLQTQQIEGCLQSHPLYAEPFVPGCWRQGFRLHCTVAAQGHSGENKGSSSPRCWSSRSSRVNAMQTNSERECKSHSGLHQCIIRCKQQKQIWLTTNSVHCTKTAVWTEKQTALQRKVLSALTGQVGSEDESWLKLSYVSDQGDPRPRWREEASIMSFP